jgi:hypothetical protein
VKIAVALKSEKNERPTGVPCSQLESGQRGWNYREILAPGSVNVIYV